MANTTDTSRIELIIERLNNVNPSDHGFSHQDCPICMDVLMPLSADQESSCQGPPVQLDCGHVFGKACISRWLTESTSCPTCRTLIIDLDLLDWRNERASILSDLTSLIQTQSHPGAIRLKAFIMREIIP